MPGDEVKEGQEAEWKMGRRKGNARPTIGILTSEASDPVSWTVWRGVHDLTQERDINLVCLVGGTLRPSSSDPGLELGTQANVLYDLVSPENVDGLVIWSGGIGQYTSAEEMKAFCEQYRPVPIVSAAVGLEGTPSVLVDNYAGMHDAILHLIEVHSYRRIAFIRGPEGHPEAEDRYRAYSDALAKYDIPLDPDLIAVGAFERTLGAEAISLLLDKRKVDFEAIAAADDDTALGAMVALQARGMGVPDDVAVVGFDDIEESRYTTPPLTTVSSPVYEQGRRATEMVLTLLEGEQVPERVYLPTKVIVRRSCGCPSPEVTRAAAGPVTHTLTGAAVEAPGGHAVDKTAEATVPVLAARREDTLSEIVQVDGPSAAGLDPGWAGQLLESFTAELGTGLPRDSADSAESPGRGQLAGSYTFLPTLNRLLDQAAAAQDSMRPWQNVLSTLRRRTLPYLVSISAVDSEVLARAEDLWQQARVLVWEAEQRVDTRRRVESELWTTLAGEVGNALAAAFGMTNLMDVIAQTLPELGISSCYLSLYEDPAAPVERSRLMLAYDEGGRVELEAGGRRFPSRQLIPGGLPHRERRYSLVAMPLYIQETQLGFVLLEVGPQDGEVYETLGAQLGGALQRALLIERTEKRALRLQTAAEISHAASSILSPDELFQRLLQTVDLIRERFDLYYVGLFLTDKTGEWAVLRAGTGEAGRKMLEQGHRLKTGGDSMIGSCVATRRARIALDVDEETQLTRFKNPFLPETRSEMALPLISRGEAIGALTIQSAEEAAFSEEDITVLQIMADQLANAIANARLFEQTQAALEEAEAVQRRYLQQAWTEYARTRKISGYEQTGAVVMPLGDEAPPGVQQAMMERRPVIRDDDGDAGSSILVVPIMLRDRPLGALGLKAGGGRQWGDEDIALAEAISQEFSQAAEALRLLDETQRLAARERLAGEVTTRMRETLDVETVLKTAVQELRQAMGLPEVVIRLAARPASEVGDGIE